ncbi:hypothetical protein BAE44_0010637, partial [Dichanthelium oligosanthes]
LHLLPAQVLQLAGAGHLLLLRWRNGGARAAGLRAWQLVPSGARAGRGGPGFRRRSRRDLDCRWRGPACVPRASYRSAGRHRPLAQAVS